jgi:hypothetical protein
VLVCAWHWQEMNGGKGERGFNWAWLCAGCALSCLCIAALEGVGEVSALLGEGHGCLRAAFCQQPAENQQDECEHE